MSKKYTHFTSVERKEFSILLKKGHSTRAIGKELGKSHSSVVREKNRNKTKEKYQSRKAHQKHKVRRLKSKYQNMKIREHSKLEKYIKKKMRKHWTPEMIAGRWNKDNHLDKNQKQIKISALSIYKYCYSKFGQSLCKYLVSRKYKPKRRKAGKKLKKAIIPNKTSIHKRSRKIDERKSFGHFEGDTLGKIKSDMSVIAGLRERLSRKLFLNKIPGLKYTVDGFKKKLNPHRNILGSLTLDNGMENVRYEELNIQTFFCDPYSSFQKGSIENGFGVLRRFIPKGSSIENLSPQKLACFERLINDFPMKCLGWKSPNEVFDSLSKSKNISS